MSFQTQPTFIHYGDWDEKTRSHPAMKWMEAYTRDVFDKRRFDLPYSDWHRSDFVLHKGDNTIFQGGEQAWAEAAKMYTPFTEFTHIPYFLACYETTDGYEMIGQAMVYGNLPGQPAAGEKQVTDTRDGKSWDVAVPGGFHFAYVREDKAPNGYGFLLKKTEIMSDSGPVVVALLKRGVLKPQDLGL